MTALPSAMLWSYGVLLFVCAFAARGNAGPATMPEVYDTIIVGMGASGCTAGSTLAKAGKKILALEAMDRVGGRVNTVPFGDGVVELGAEWIHGQFPSRIYDLALQNNVSILPQDLDFDIYRSDGSPGEKEVLNDLMLFSLGVVDDPPQVPEPLGQYITKRLTDYIKTKYPHLLNDKDFMDNLLQFLDLIIDNYESSNSWNDVSTQSRYEELGGHQHMSWHRHGYKTLFQILLNTYNNGPGYPNLEIKLKKEVTQIIWPQDPTQDVVVNCKDGTSYRAKNVIVTVSLGVLKERHNTLFTPSLPQEKATAIDKISIGVEGKVVLLFDTPLWHTNKTWHLFLWRGIDKKDITTEDRWITRIDEASVPMGNCHALSVWLSGDRAKLTRKTLLANIATITAIEKMSIGVVGKVVLLFEKSWWNGSIWYPFLWRGEDRKTLSKEDYWMTNLSYATTSMGNSQSMSLWSCGDIAKLVGSIEFYAYATHTSIFSPSLPKDKVIAIDNLAIGVVDKIVLHFPKAWWPRTATFSGFVWHGADRKNVSKEDYWTTKIFGASTPMGSHTALTLWTSGDGAKLVETLPEDVVKRKVMELIRRFMGKNRTIPEPIAMLRSSWFSNPYTRGSYTYDNVLTPQFPNARATLAEPLVDSSGAPRVLFAGEATDNTHFSTVHGATDTGFREANRLLPQAKL